DGYDFVNDDEDPMDDYGHGTHCAGIAAGNGNVKGVAPDAILYAYKVLNEMGGGTEADVILGIERAVDPNNDDDFSDCIDVISMSLGGYGNPDDPASQAVDNAVENGVVVVISAGNSGPSQKTIRSPGTSRKAITVGASCKTVDIGTDNYCSSAVSSFSSRGPVVWKEGSMIKPDVIAPGVNIISTVRNGGYESNSGTSMAAPHVAGAAALLIQAHSDWLP
ncbi:unnamed protein product, partial [marine sediment metagenome]